VIEEPVEGGLLVSAAGRSCFSDARTRCQWVSSVRAGSQPRERSHQLAAQGQLFAAQDDPAVAAAPRSLNSYLVSSERQQEPDIPQMIRRRMDRSIDQAGVVFREGTARPAR
jgi:hypothetical protein